MSSITASHGNPTPSSPSAATGAGTTDVHRVVIVGGGFAGLEAAKALRRSPVQVTLLDRRNHHLFQPLLYQVATGGLSPGDIASPLRAIVDRQANVRVLQAEARDIDPAEDVVLLADRERLPFDSLIVATGQRSHYFGHKGWATHAPALKSIEDALEMRRRILGAFEAAERGANEDEREAWLTFVVVGGGPTGVELCGALAELSRETLRDDFRAFDPRRARIVLVEALDRLLVAYPRELSARAADTLRGMGVEIQLDAMVTAIDDRGITFEDGSAEERIHARTVLWAAGLRPTAMAKRLRERRGGELDDAGRVIVGADLALPEHPNVFVAGDIARVDGPDGDPLPGVAPVAMQEGRHAARAIRARLGGQATPPFRYRDRGIMAVIGRNAAVANVKRFQLSGRLAWWIWLFVHIAFLIGYDNKLRVLLQWAWMYTTRKRGARLITEERGTDQERSDAEPTRG